MIFISHIELQYHPCEYGLNDLTRPKLNPAFSAEKPPVPLPPKFGKALLEDRYLSENLFFGLTLDPLVRESLDRGLSHPL